MCLQQDIVMNWKETEVDAEEGFSVLSGMIRV